MAQRTFNMTIVQGLLTSVLVASLQLNAGAASLQNSFDIVVPQPPGVAMVEGKAMLVYELHLTNFSNTSLTIHAVRALDGDNDKPLSVFTGADLKNRENLLGESLKPSGDDLVVPPGRRDVIYLEFWLPSAQLPGSIRHEIDYSTGAKPGNTTVAAGRIKIGTQKYESFAPPLRGGPWLAAHDPAWETGHRRVFYSVGGKAHIPARFAIDWVRIDDAGRTTHGDANRVADTLGYGDDVLAVADARVVGVRDNLSEPSTISNSAKHEIAEDAGNYVVLGLKDGRYVFYEHLKPGSIRVKDGQTVARGEVIGSLGFSGESTGPHLHFHVADGPTPLDAEGLPFAIDGFRLLGRYQDIAAFGRERWQPLQSGIAAERSREWLDSNVVVQFPP
jgi:hypothetical protein